MNTPVTSKEEILKTCREMVSQDGLAAVSMRAVAGKCHIALGSLYYYFSGKDELMLETIASVWRDIFQMDRCDDAERSFVGETEWIFDRVRAGMQRYPNFFTAHSLSFASDGKSRAKETMDRFLGHMRSELEQKLKTDRLVRREVFSDDFPEAQFADFVLSGVIVLLLQQKSDCRVLTEMIRKTIY